MKKILLTLFLLYAELSISNAQSFLVQLSPDTIFMNLGQTDTISLNIIPYGGFNSSVFLSLDSFQTSLVTITPSILNPPYNNCNVIVSASNLGPGIHKLIIKGEQGAIISYDTAYVIVLFDPNLQWYEFKEQNSGLLCNVAGDITFDKSNNIWLSSYTTCGISNSGISEYNHTGWDQWSYNSYKLTDFWGNLISQQNNSMLSNCNGMTTTIETDTSNIKWIGTSNGLIKYNDTTFNILFPTEFITKIATYNDKICVGTWLNGIKYFNGTNWLSFDTSNSYLPDNEIRAITMENDTDLWIGTSGGLAHFDLNFWTIYNSSNSIISNNIITSVAIDIFGNKYVSALGTGLIKFDNVTWQQFFPPCQEISTICPDHLGNIWLGFHSGNTNNAVVKFDGTNWSVFNSSNSGFNSDATTAGYGRIRCIKEDMNNVIWISTFGDGLYAYRDSGLGSIFPPYLLTDIPKPPIRNSFHFNIFPNPNDGNFSIELIATLNENIGIRIYNIQGQTVYNNKFHFENFISKRIEVNDLKNGIYIVSLSNSNIVITKKIIVLRN